MNFLKSQSALAADLSTRDARILDLESQLTNLQSQLATANDELVQLRAGRDNLESQLSALEQQQTTVSAGVAATVAALGVPAGELPGAQAESDVSDAAIYDQWKALAGKEKSIFFRDNKAALDRYAAEQSKN